MLALAPVAFVVDNNGGTGYTSGTSYTVKANTGDGCPNFTKSQVIASQHGMTMLV